MTTAQSFGGRWTVEKLDILSDYLDFYVTALKNQPFELIYIDAFAGTGQINLGGENSSSDEQQAEQIGMDFGDEPQSKSMIIDGSAKLALQAKEKFSHYFFIEKSKKRADELETLVDTEFPKHKSCVEIIKGRDCNDVLLEMCHSIDWRKKRAVLFLDPFAANVKWETLQAIARTQAIDVWYLFPFSVPIRLMKKDGNIDPTWKEKLNYIFGDNSWEQEFYEKSPQLSLFDTQSLERDVNTDKMKSYIEKRLATVFSKVSTHSRILYNSKNSPLFMFCFAVSNPNRNAQDLALRGANYILRNKG